MEQELMEVEPKRKRKEIKMVKQEKTIYDLPGVGAEIGRASCRERVYVLV